MYNVERNAYLTLNQMRRYGPSSVSSLCAFAKNTITKSIIWTSYLLRMHTFLAIWIWLSMTLCLWNLRQPLGELLYHFPYWSNNFENGHKYLRACKICIDLAIDQIFRLLQSSHHWWRSVLGDCHHVRFRDCLSWSTSFIGCSKIINMRNNASKL